jgi:hypothetical protein
MVCRGCGYKTIYLFIMILMRAIWSIELNHSVWACHSIMAEGLWSPNLMRTSHRTIWPGARERFGQVHDSVGGSRGTRFGQAHDSVGPAGAWFGQVMNCVGARHFRRPMGHAHDSVGSSYARSNYPTLLNLGGRSHLKRASNISPIGLVFWSD